MRYEFHPEAFDQYREATLHYADRDPALALRFVEAVGERPAVNRRTLVLDVPAVI